MKIPQVIHQIYLQGSLPARLEGQVSSLKERNPGWEHRLYDLNAGEALIREHFSDELLQAFRLINPEYGAAKADFLRHLIIYHHGGVYLDIKSDLTQPLSDVIRVDDEYILSQWRNGPGELHEGFGLHPELSHVPGGEFQTYFIMATKQHPLSKAAIEAISRNILRYKPWSGVGKMGVIRTTGPSAYTLAIYPELKNCSYRLSSEEELGAKMSIDDYQHEDVFKSHYASLTTPVVQLSRVGSILQSLIERLRQLKYLSRNSVRSLLVK